MSDKLEALERLSRLLDEGKISSTEYEKLKSELLADSAHASASDQPSDDQPSGLPDPPSRTPGWYDDPGDGPRQRYWNGWWTSRYRDKPSQTGAVDEESEMDQPTALSGDDKKTLWGCLFVILLGVAGIAVWVAVLNGSDGGSGNGDLPGAFVACRSFVRNELVAPSTADFHGWASEQTEHLGGGRYRTDSYVDSENSFGAMVRTHYTCVVRDSGGDWVLESLTYR